MVSAGVVRHVRDRIECLRVRPLLQPFLDGQLDDARQTRFEAHLAACRRCGLAVETYRSLITRLQDSEQPVNPEAVDRLREFVERLEAEATGEGGPKDLPEGGTNDDA